MTYLIWAIINVSAGILILFLLYRFAKLISLLYGAKGVAVLILILLSLFHFLPKESEVERQVWNFESGEHVHSFHQNYAEILDENPLFTIQLHLISLKDQDRAHERTTKAFSSVSGIIGYNNWTSDNVTIKTRDDHFEYTVTGEMKWKFLNYTIYTEQKTYRGQVKKV